MGKRKPDSIRIIRVVIISDTHERHGEIQVPAGDVLIHCGDLTIFSKSTAAIRDFNDWLGARPHPRKIVVPGNHDFAFEKQGGRDLITEAVVLINEGFEVDGLRIWGSPVTPMRGGAFGISAEQERTKIFARIPDDTDILITHGPPFGLLDQSVNSGEHIGCRQLLGAVRRVKPRIHAFGHVHGAYGTKSAFGTLFVNAALAGTDDRMRNCPIVLDIEQDGSLSRCFRPANNRPDNASASKLE